MSKKGSLLHFSALDAGRFHSPKSDRYF